MPKSKLPPAYSDVPWLIHAGESFIAIHEPPHPSWRCHATRVSHHNRRSEVGNDLDSCKFLADRVETLLGSAAQRA